MFYFSTLIECYEYLELVCVFSIWGLNSSDKSEKLSSTFDKNIIIKLPCISLCSIISLNLNCEKGRNCQFAIIHSVILLVHNVKSLLHILKTIFFAIVISLIILFWNVCLWSKNSWQFSCFMGPDVLQTYKWVFSGFAVIDRFSVNIGRPCEGLKFTPTPQPGA